MNKEKRILQIGFILVITILVCTNIFYQLDKRHHDQQQKKELFEAITRKQLKPGSTK